MTEATDTNPGTTIFEDKFTAAQIEENCPVMLQDLGKRIAVHSEKAQKCEDKSRPALHGRCPTTCHGARSLRRRRLQIISGNVFPEPGQVPRPRVARDRDQ